MQRLHEEGFTLLQHRGQNVVQHKGVYEIWEGRQGIEDALEGECPSNATPDGPELAPAPPLGYVRKTQTIINQKHVGGRGFDTIKKNTELAIESLVGRRHEADQVHEYKKTDE